MFHLYEIFQVLEHPFPINRRERRRCWVWAWCLPTTVPALCRGRYRWSLIHSAPFWGKYRWCWVWAWCLPTPVPSLCRGCYRWSLIHSAPFGGKSTSVFILEWSCQRVQAWEDFRSPYKSVCLCWCFTSQSTIFLVMLWWFTVFLGWISTK